MRRLVLRGGALLAAVTLLAGCASPEPPTPTPTPSPSPSPSVDLVLEIEELSAEVLGFGQQSSGSWWIAVEVTNPNEGIAVPRGVTLNGFAADGTPTNQSRDFPTDFLPGKTTTVIVREIDGVPERFDVGLAEAELSSPGEFLEPYRVTGELTAAPLETYLDPMGETYGQTALASTLATPVAALASVLVRDGAGQIVWADSFGLVDLVPAGNRALLVRAMAGAPDADGATVTAQVIPPEFAGTADAESNLVFGASGVGPHVSFASRTWYAVEITNPGPEPVMDRVRLDFYTASGALATSMSGPGMLPVGTTIEYGILNPLPKDWIPTRVEAVSAGAWVEPLGADGALSIDGATLGEVEGWPLLSFSVTSSYPVPFTAQVGGVCRDAAGAFSYAEPYAPIDLTPGQTVPVEFIVPHRSADDGGTCAPAVSILNWDQFEERAG